MAKILTKNVRLWNPSVGKRVELRSGEEVPDWADDLITNPKVFREDDDIVKVDPEGSESSEEESFDDGLPDLEEMTVQSLREFADDLDIDLGDATRKADIIDRIRESIDDSE